MLRNGLDYRTPSGQLAYQDIKQKKTDLAKCIHKEHPRQKNEYNAVSDKSSRYYDDFCKIYNFRCAYCGVKVGIMDSQMFEIDHFQCESSYSKTTEGRSIAGKVDNLVFSCLNCNRGKKDFIIENRYVDLLNPDNNAITKVFYRSKDYHIEIRDKYKDDTVIRRFYFQLNLGSELKRLDFLLLSIDELIEQERQPWCDKIIHQKLESCFYILSKKRNTLSFKLSKTTR